MPTERPNAEERLTDLESRYSELERLVDALNEVIVEHTARLEELSRENAELRRIAAQASQDAANDAPPPHY